MSYNPPPLPDPCFSSMSCTPSSFNNFLSFLWGPSLNFINILYLVMVVSSIALFIKTKTMWSIVLGGMGFLAFVTNVWGNFQSANTMWGFINGALLLAFGILLWMIYKRLRE